MENNEKKSSYVIIAEFAMMAFYIFMGVMILLFTKEVMTILCKIVFGIMIFIVGIHSIIGYSRHKDGKNIFDMFAGISMALIGAYMLYNSELVIRLLPSLFGCILIPGGYYTLKKGFENKIVGGIIWKILVFGSLIEIALVGALILRPMRNLQISTLITGLVFFLEGILFIVMLFLSGRKIMLRIPEKEKIADLIDENKEQAKIIKDRIKKEKDTILDKIDNKVNGKKSSSQNDNQEQEDNEDNDNEDNDNVDKENNLMKEIEEATNKAKATDGTNKDVQTVENEEMSTMVKEKTEDDLLRENDSNNLSVESVNENSQINS